MSTKLSKILIWLVCFAVCFLLGLSFWYTAKSRRVLVGTAEPNFPFSDYTTTQLRQLYPQEPNVNVDDTHSPEQTYAQLRQYVREEKISQALTLFSSRYQERYKSIFEQAQSKGTWAEFYTKLESQIVKDQNNCWLTICTYIMKESGVEINFIKDKQGVWLIESL